MNKVGTKIYIQHCAYRTRRHKSTGVKPFYATYGRLENTRVRKDDNKITLLERVKTLIEEIPKLRMIMKENITNHKRNKRNTMIKRLKRHRFEIGDKVLLFKSSKDKTHSGKLEGSWNGPYLIHEDLGNGSYKLKTLDGKIFRIPQNGELLKIFYERRKY
jgi:hypothetical protein